MIKDRSKLGSMAFEFTLFEASDSFTLDRIFVRLVGWEQFHTNFPPRLICGVLIQSTFRIPIHPALMQKNALELK